MEVICYRKHMRFSFIRSVHVEVWLNGRCVDQRLVWGVWATKFFEWRLKRKIRMAMKMAGMLAAHSSK